MFDVPAGSLSTIDVWARPAATMTLGGFSLSLVAEQPGAITFAKVEVLNPHNESNNTVRHQIVFDSTVEWSAVETIEGEDVEVMHTYDEYNLYDDHIDHFLGLSLLNDSEGLENGGGIGPECADTECYEIGGAPAWRIATVTFDAGASGNSTELYLEIGTQGIWYMGDASAQTSALFGVPDDENPADARIWSPGDTGGHGGLPDAVINVVPTDADFDDDGDVDGVDFQIWQRGYGIGSLHSEGDADGNGTIDGEDLAVWQNQFSTALSPAVATIPEPTTLTCLAIVLCGLTATKRGKYHLNAVDLPPKRLEL